MNKAEFSRFMEEDLRYYIEIYHKDFNLKKPLYTNITGTPDVVATGEDGKAKWIELKIGLSSISNQIRKGRLNLIHEVWFIYDNASQRVKEILNQNNIKLVNISEELDMPKLEKINILARRCYHFLINFHFLLTDPMPMLEIIDKMGLEKPWRHIYYVDDFFHIIHKASINNEEMYLELEKAKEEYERKEEEARIPLMKEYREKILPPFYKSET